MSYLLGSRPQQGGSSTGVVDVDAISVFNVQSYGASPLGLVDSRAAITAALAAAAAAGGGVVYLPPGTYSLSRTGSLTLDIPGDNIRIMGVRGLTWLKHEAGMPAQKIPIIRCMNRENVTFDSIGIDGNWGWTVGTDGQGGRNHADMEDPGNYGIQLRSSRKVLITNCMFRQTYGDAIWIGSGGGSLYSEGCKDIRIEYCDIDTAARDGIALGQQCERITIDTCTIVNTYSQCIDSEPVEQGINGVTINNCYLRTWWNCDTPDRSTNLAITVVGGKFISPGFGAQATGYRITNNNCDGGILVEAASNVVVSGNTVICDYDNFGYGPITVQMYADNVAVTGNTCWLSCRTAYGSGALRSNDAAISVQVHTTGSWNNKPANVLVANNTCNVQNARRGIKVEGTGGPAMGVGATFAGETGTITSITEVTAEPAGSSVVEVAGKAWTENQWTGWWLRSGRAVAMIAGNDADTLTLWQEDESSSPAGTDKKSAWTDYLDQPIALPLAGASYTIFYDSGIVDIHDNIIDCTNWGDGNGGDGIEVNAFRAGTRARIRNNTIRNANAAGVSLLTYDTNRPFEILEVTGNMAWDDQLVGTCTTVIKNTAPVGLPGTIQANKLILDGNIGSTYNVAGVPTEMTRLSGLTTGWWLERAGVAPVWNGYGTPEGVVTAPVGAIAIRLDGGASTTLYVKTSGTGNTGWTAK